MFGGLVAFGGGIAAQRAARDCAKAQAEQFARQAESGNAYIGCHAVDGLAGMGFYSDTPSAFGAIKGKAMTAARCQSCAAPMAHNVCDYCGTSHR